MFERMLNKQTRPTLEAMTNYCGNNAKSFAQLNLWLSTEYATMQKIVFPYGNHYGWGIAYYKKKKLICTIFAEIDAFTVMIRLSNAQIQALQGHVQQATQDYLDNKYPCGDGGWIHYRVVEMDQLPEIEKLLIRKWLG